MQKGLGFRPGPHDERDRPLRVALERTAVEKTVGQTFWSNSLRLDQGQEGACVGFGWTQSINSSPKARHYDDAHARSIYYRARQLDEWPGEDYEGTSVRAGAKSVKEKGWIKSYGFEYDPRNIALWILNRGPVVIGVDWYEGMYEAKGENDYYIKPEGEITGGHCTLLDGVRWNASGSYFRGLNSWGRSWGYNGRFRISVPDLEKLFDSPHAVAATAMEV